MSVFLLCSVVSTAVAVDLTWMAQEQNCKQFIRKFQAELRGESGIRDLPEGEQQEARAALRKACAGPIGRCEFSFCAVGEEAPVLLTPPASKVDIGKLLASGEEVTGAKEVDVPGLEERPPPKLPAERMVPTGDPKGAKGGGKQAAAARDRHPLYDPRQRRLLDELEAEDAAESKRQAEMRAAEERMKEQLLRELGGQDPSQQVGLNLDAPPLVAAVTAPGEPTPTATISAEETAPATVTPLPEATALPSETAPPEEPEVRPTPEVSETPKESLPLPPLEGVRPPTSPWSRAGTFPRVSISQQIAGAPLPAPPTAEQLARAADEARRVRLSWLKADMGCKDLLGEIKSRYSDVRPAAGFSKEVKLDLWEVLNTACSARFARCKFPQCAKLQKLTAQTDAARAAEDEAKALAHEQLTAAARSDLDAEVHERQSYTTSLIRDAEQRERREKLVWQKFQMQSEIVDRAAPAAEAEPSSKKPAAATKAAGNKAQYDPTVYADPRDLDRKPRPAGSMRGDTGKGKTTSEQRVRESQNPPEEQKRKQPAAAVPPPSRIF